MRNSLLLTLKNEIKSLKIYYFCFLPSIFIFVIIINVQGLLPFVFTSTSHLRVRMSLGLRF
ncbi:MAG: hypothetical protein DI617_08455 [Streptococcus pyogenes]|nr:MAG: hypothetical protein DI617_08455 [Streptococcus pyogenes]